MKEAQARAYLEVLAKVTSSVELGPVGFAARRSDAFAAYGALSADREMLARVEPELMQIASTGAPGAVIYAALLLRALGRDLATALAPYADDRRELVVWPGGCMPQPPMWLCEAVRWVQGESWRHPAHVAQELEKQRAAKLEDLARATYFELPSEQALEFQEKGIVPRDIDSVWTRRFLELFCGPRAELRALRAGLDALATHPSIATRVYAALLVRAIDRAAGQRALDALAASGLSVPCHRKGDVPIGDVVAQLTRWP